MSTSGSSVDASVSRKEAQDVLAFTDAFLAYLYTFRDRYHGFLKRRARAADRQPLRDEPTATSAVAAGAASPPSNGDRPG